MPSSRAGALLVTVAAAALVAGCGGSNPGEGATSAEPAGSATTAAAGVVWADDVCSASSELQATVDEARGAPEVDPTGSETSLDQARTQAQEDVAAVRESASALGATLTEIPAGAEPGLVEAQEQLQTASERAQDAVDQLGTVAAEITEAETPAEITVGLGALGVALRGTAEDVSSYVDLLAATVNDGEEAVRDAFGAAPACAALSD